MAGMAVVTTVASSICMNSAHPTSKGNTLALDFCEDDGSGGLGEGVDGEGGADMERGGNASGSLE